MNYTVNPFWQQRIADTFTNAISAYPRVLMLRVDLRLPNIPADTDAAVISRFIDSLKEKIAAYLLRKHREGNRKRMTDLRYIWAKEYGMINGNKHYHVVLLLNREVWCSAGNYNDSASLAGLIKQAWCSALRVSLQEYSTLAHFPENPVSWINQGSNEELQEALVRASYLAKDYTKVTGNRERNFGCSQR